MMEFGPQFSLVGLTVELRSVGVVPLIIGRGVAAVIGTAVRGPIGEPILLGSSVDARATFYSGPLATSCDLMFGNGADVVAAIRVGGVGNATAEAEIADGIGVPKVVGKLVASSPGAWGNNVRYQIAEGSYPAFETGILTGDGTIGPYYLENWDIEEDAGNFIRVSGVPREIVYNPGLMEAGKVYVNKTEGSYLFYADEGVDVDTEIEYSLKFKTRRIILTDGIRQESHPFSSYVKLQAALLGSALARYEPTVGETHLPKLYSSGSLAGGSDGAAIQIADWRTAMGMMLSLPQGVVPTTCYITSREVVPGSNDLIPEFSLMLYEAANKFIPMIGFVGAAPNTSMGELLRLKSAYNNPFLAIVGNPWDNSQVEKDLAAARAGTEAGLALGESAAQDNNAIQGANDLLNIFDQEEVDVLTYNGVDMLIKSVGIKPYLGVTTNPDPNFLRTVDMRTVCYSMVVLNYVAKRFFHKRRTRQNMSDLKATLDIAFAEMVRLQILDDFKITVRANALDRNKVDIDLWIQCVGHIERIHTVLSVGYWSTALA